MNKVLALMISVVFLVFSSHASAERTGVLSAKLLCGKKTNSNELTVGRYETLIDIANPVGFESSTTVTVRFPSPKYASQSGDAPLVFQYGFDRPIGGGPNPGISQVNCETVRQLMIPLGTRCQDNSTAGFSNCALNNRFFEAMVTIISVGAPLTDDLPISVTGTYTVKQRNGNNADKKIYDSQTIDIVNYSWLYFNGGPFEEGGGF